jgi:hypothetical protein
MRYAKNEAATAERWPLVTKEAELFAAKSNAYWRELVLQNLNFQGVNLHQLTSLLRNCGG